MAELKPPFDYKEDDLKDLGNGLRCAIVAEGSGKTPEKGDNIKVNYEGRLADGTVFDSSFARNEPVVFPIGVGRLIDGWDVGFLKLKEGDKATLRVPPEMGYGAQGVPEAGIPGNAELVFDVELIAIVK